MLTKTKKTGLNLKLVTSESTEFFETAESLQIKPVKIVQHFPQVFGMKS